MEEKEEEEEEEEEEEDDDDDDEEVFSGKGGQLREFQVVYEPLSSA